MGVAPQQPRVQTSCDEALWAHGPAGQQALPQACLLRLLPLMRVLLAAVGAVLAVAAAWQLPCAGGHVHEGEVPGHPVAQVFHPRQVPLTLPWAGCRRMTSCCTACPCRRLARALPAGQPGADAGHGGDDVAQEVLQDVSHGAPLAHGAWGGAEDTGAEAGETGGKLARPGAAGEGAWRRAGGGVHASCLAQQHGRQQRHLAAAGVEGDGGMAWSQEGPHQEAHGPLLLLLQQPPSWGCCCAAAAAACRMTEGEEARAPRPPAAAAGAAFDALRALPAQAWT